MRNFPAVRIHKLFLEIKVPGLCRNPPPEVRSLRMVCALEARIFSTNPRMPPILILPCYEEEVRRARGEKKKAGEQVYRDGEGRLQGLQKGSASSALLKQVFRKEATWPVSWR